MQIHTKRIYDDPAANDGLRILVDRIWPRGVSKEDARLDQWIKDIAPCTELRQWFNHDPDKWDAFKQRYFKELKNQDKKLKSLLDDTDKQRITLVYAASDRQHNNAIALREYLLALIESTDGQQADT